MPIVTAYPFGRAVTAAIIAHGESDPTREICGIVWATLTGWRYQRETNRAADQRQHFEIHLAAMHAPAPHQQPIAIIHSHPDGPAWPSVDDMRQQQASGLCWGIYVPRALPDSGLFWFGGEYRYPIQRRPYRHGVTDCYALVRDWFAQEFQIHLIDRPRAWDWWHQDENLYAANFHAANFHRLPPDAPLQRGDIGLARILSPVINHALIWLGDGCVLHHLAGQHAYDQARMPRIDPAERWHKYIDHWVRHDRFRTVENDEAK